MTFRDRTFSAAKLPPRLHPASARAESGIGRDAKNRLPSRRVSRASPQHQKFSGRRHLLRCRAPIHIHHHHLFHIHHHNEQSPRNAARRPPHGRRHARPKPSRHERPRASHGQGGAFPRPIPQENPLLSHKKTPSNPSPPKQTRAFPPPKRMRHTPLTTTPTDASRHGILRHQTRHVRRRRRRHGRRLRPLHVQRTSLLLNANPQKNKKRD